MSYKFAEKKLMTPGPVPVPAFVAEVFVKYQCHHRVPEFSQVLGRVLKNLKKVYQTEEHCFILPCTGSGGMEAAIVNTLQPGDKVLVLSAGKFGERWKNISQVFGLDVTDLQLPWGEDIDLDLVKSELAKQNYKALLCQASETSTGALLPIQQLGDLLKDSETLFIVDAITALGAVDIPMDEWSVDVMVGGSQKAFMLPTGLATIALSKKAEAAAQKSQIPKFYWNLAKEKASNLDQKTRYSTPTHFVLAMDRVLHHILEENGLKKYFQLIENRAQFFRNAVDLEVFPKTPSPSLTCMSVPEGVSAQAIRKQMQADGIVIMAGQDQLKDKVLRVGHMGDMSEADLKETADMINNAVQ